jgi:CheY-like chemotaxis protein
VSGDTPEPAGGTPRRAATILVVDDQSVSRDVIRAALDLAGYDVLEAASPTVALELARSAKQLDLVVADVVMPEMDAFELRERLERELPDVRVLFTSGYADAAEEGPFIGKPFTPGELVAKVEDLLSST